MGHIRLFALVCIGVIFSSGCATVQNGIPLRPAGPLADGPTIIREVKEKSPASGLISPGDKIVAIDDTEVHSITEFYGVLAKQKHKTVILEKRDGNTRKLPIEVIADPETYESWAFPFKMGETLVYLQNNVEGKTQLSGLLYAGKLSGVAMATFWERDTNILEIRVELRVPNRCTTCTLENIAVMDWSAKSWLQPAPLVDVAWNIYPPLKQPAPPINVPPPVAVGYTGTSSAMGNISGYNYGNFFSGTYSGQTVSSLTPQYDYTMTNIAALHNLGSAIQRSKIQEQNKRRMQFVSIRAGNLRFGQLNAGERMIGHIFFVVPKYLSGPFILYIDAGKNNVGFVRFDLDKTKATE